MIHHNIAISVPVGESSVAFILTGSTGHEPLLVHFSNMLKPPALVMALRIDHMHLLGDV